MSRINCHSAFKHYEMFHSSGGDVINIGSNNTTVFNMGNGFGGSGFWGGVGYGLGNAFGSIFGGMFGGGYGNMGGFGNFGGGFGMSPFGFGNIFGGGGISSGKSSGSEDGKGKVKDSVNGKNVDYAKLNKLFERKNDIEETDKPKLEDLKKLKADIDKLAKELDGNDDGNDNNYIKQLRRGLDKKIAEAEAREKAQTDKPETTSGNAGGGNATTGAGAGAGNTNGAGAGAGNTNGAGAGAGNGTGDGVGAEPWAGVTGWNSDKNLIPENITLPAGYSKLGENDKIDKIELAHDLSRKTQDVSGSSKKSSDTFKAQDKATNFPTYVAITTGNSNAYNYKCIGMSGGYPIYGTPSSDKNKNVYVMCKDSNGKVVLLQLDKFSGYGIKDTQN